MQTLPNIMPLEVMVVTAAVLLLWMAPALLSWVDQRRRLRSLAEASRIDDGDAAPATAAMFEPAPVALAGEVTEVPTGVEEAAAPEPSRDESYSEAPPSDEPRAAGSGANAPHYQGSGRYHFRLQDLRRVRLRDWPPLTIRNDPQRHRVWLEAERLVEDHESVINATVISSSYPAQSVCLGAAEVEGSKLRLRFLLFPVLWPAQENDALAEAIFEVDRSGGEVISWVQARLKD